MKKRKNLIILLAVLWITLVLMLAAVERAAPGSRIASVGDALWYSLVTMSTVGYGDVVPVSAPGRLIGCAFVCLSVGVFALLIGAAVSVFSGKLIAPLRIRLNARDNKYIFREWNDPSRALLENLREADPGALTILLRAPDARPDGIDICLDASPEHVARLAGGGSGKVSVFLMDDSQAANIAEAKRLAGKGFPVYCRTESAVPWTFEDVVFFSPLRCCARCYWQEHPLTGLKHNLVLIGDGKLCAELLEQALLVNVFDEKQQIVYHVTGALEDFAREHTQLAQVATLNSERPEYDAIYFHNQKWNALGEQLMRADRVIICEDDDARNLEILLALKRSYPLAAEVHAKLSVPGEGAFGCDDEIFAPRYVMQEQLNETARALHEIYRESAGGSAPSWAELDDFKKASNIAAADHLFTKIRLLLPEERFTEITPELCGRAAEAYLAGGNELRERCRRIEHERWMRFHELHNWVYAKERNNAAWEHNLLCPFDKLSPQEQAKDDYSWEILEKLAK